MPRDNSSAAHLGDGAYVSAQNGSVVLTANHHDPELATDAVWLDPGAAQALADWLAERGIQGRSREQRG